MSNKTYDVLKNIALIFVPLSAFIVSVLGIFEVPNADKITALITAIDTCLGALVKTSQVIYDNKKKEELEMSRAINQQEGE